MRLRTSVYPSVSGWYTVLNRNSVPLSRKSSRQNKLMKIGSRSEMILLGKPCNLQKMSINRVATLYAEWCGGKAPKWAPLEKRSTTTKIVVKPWDWGSPMMKSIEMSTQIPFGIDRGWRRPATSLVSYFVCWNVGHWDTKRWTKLHIPSQLKLSWMQHNVFMILKCPPRAIEWYSYINKGMKEQSRGSQIFLW